VAGGDTPVSWFLIEPGWEVVDAAGEHVGLVEETTGDSTHDIFDGLSIAPGVFAAARYVPSEQVGEIVEGRVQLKLTKDEVEHLGEYEEPPTTAAIEQEQAGLGTRVAQPFEAPIRARPGGWWRRVTVRLRTLLRLSQR
jgi:Uncharacterized protein conserved in bacteria (DUF2171)